jgi:hypothetical protein
MVAYLSVKSGRNFENFLQVIDKVEFGRTSIEKFRSNVTEARIGHLTNDSQLQDCAYTLQTRNSLLHRLGLAPLGVVQSGLTFKNGLASQIHIVFEIRNNDARQNSHNDLRFVVFQDGERGSCHDQFDLSLKRDEGNWLRLEWMRARLPRTVGGLCLSTEHV